MIAADNVINVKQFINSIDDNEDVTFKLYKDGDYSHITYKEMMTDILRGRTQVTISEMLQLIHEKVDTVIIDHVYFSKAAAS